VSAGVVAADDPDWMEARSSPSGVDICFVIVPPGVYGLPSY